jgi:Ca2+-binding RTX toxin-like protein
MSLSMHPLRSVLLATLAALPLVMLGAPAVATASTAQVNFNGTLFFFAAAGETNDVTVAKSGANFVITDPGAPITPGTGCAAVNANQVSCPGADVTGIEIRLGDLNDRATVADTIANVSTDFFDPDVEIRGEQGADVLNGGVNARNELIGGFPSFFSISDPSTNTLTGGSKRDGLQGADGNDVMAGGGGSDSFFGDLGNDVMNGGPGSDRFEDSGGPDGADLLIGGPNVDDVEYSRAEGVRVALNNVADDGANCPGAGCENDNVRDDVEDISTADGNDVIIGAAPPNNVFSGDGNDTVDTGAGDDRIFAADGEDSLLGGTGDDVLFGSEGSDLMRGAAGDDTLFSTGFDDDADNMFGGTGLDLADYLEANSGVKVSLDNKPNDGVAAEKDNVHRDVEDVLGSDFNDVLVGSKFSNELDGGNGRDRLRGLGGLDGLLGGRSADFLAAGGGADTLDSGAGPDRLLARGGGADDLSCGSSVDRGTADFRDRLAGDCDRVKRSRGRR